MTNIINENTATAVNQVLPEAPAHDLVTHFFIKSTRSFIEERFRSLCSAQ